MAYDVEDQYLENFPYYGRFGQDKFVYEHFFQNKKDGVFVDIGAYDGVESSNTLFFEESLGWQGVCVEPIPDIYEKLKLNRKSICLNCCASDYEGISDFLHVKPNIRPKKEGSHRTSNYEKLSGLVEFYNDEHKTIIDNIISQVGGEKKLMHLPCQHINLILAATGRSHIDLLSIDTEGSEMHILQNINFKDYSFSVIIVEALYGTEIMDNFLENQGYSNVQKIGYDIIYVSKILM